MGTCGGAKPPSDIDEARAEAIADAKDVLDDLSLWRLTSARWEQVARILRALDAAVAVGDLAAMREATAELELAGPVRFTRLGATPVEPAPPPVRERTNHLVHRLTAMTQDSGASRRLGGEGERPASG